MPTKTTVNKTKGVIGDKLILTAKVTDINGNPDPEIIKKRYKTRNGILSYLYYQMVDWTDKKEKDNLSL